MLYYVFRYVELGRAEIVVVSVGNNINLITDKF